MKPRGRTGMLTALIVLVAVAGDANAQSAASKAAPASIPTVSLKNVARHGFFYAGGKYVGELGADKESTMGGAMYVEVMVPKQIRSPYPVVFLHGAGQTGVDWLQTPDGRPGWAYNFLDMGYVVYLQDFPTRGRSQYVPGVDGTPGQLEPEHPNGAEPRGDLHGRGRARQFSRRPRSTRSGRAPAASATRSSTTSPRRRCSSSPAAGRRR